jgi:hypothetical protein
MAETKSRLRAVRSLEVRTSYSPEELRKPFVVARCMWTGQTDDDELRRTFAIMQAERFMGARAALYGGGPSRHALPPAPRPIVIPAPPVGTVVDRTA